MSKVDIEFGRLNPAIEFANATAFADNARAVIRLVDRHSDQGEVIFERDHITEHDTWDWIAIVNSFPVSLNQFGLSDTTEIWVRLIVN